MSNNTKEEGKKKKKEEVYLSKIFSLLRTRENIVINDKKSRFNHTEMRMLGEIVSAKCEGRRLISTRLAELLGVTRSAVSQIVNHLEAQGVVQRVPDDSDKKIAYIELTEGVLETYGKELENCFRFVGNLVDEFGEENFYQMCELFEGFIALAQQKMQNKKD